MKEAKAEDIFEKIVMLFNDHSIPYEKNSVMSRLKAEIPHIFLLKCICHSFHLCASRACSKLPKAVEDANSGHIQLYCKYPTKGSGFEGISKFYSGQNS